MHKFKFGQNWPGFKPQLHAHLSCYMVVSSEKQWHVQPVTGHSLWLLWKQNVSGKGVKVESLDEQYFNNSPKPLSHVVSMASMPATLAPREPLVQCPLRTCQTDKLGLTTLPQFRPLSCTQAHILEERSGHVPEGRAWLAWDEVSRRESLRMRSGAYGNEVRGVWE